VLTADDSLWALAAREYGNPRYWRKIARHNGIENPRRLTAGTTVVLPPLEKDDEPART
jgi:nucleoid-associated protein YgaU